MFGLPPSVRIHFATELAELFANEVRTRGLKFHLAVQAEPLLMAIPSISKAISNVSLATPLIVQEIVFDTREARWPYRVTCGDAMRAVSMRSRRPDKF